MFSSGSLQQQRQTWEIVEYFAFSMFFNFPCFSFCQFFNFSFFHFLMCVLLFFLLFFFCFDVFYLFLSPFSFFFLFPFFFSFFQSSEQTPKPEKNSRKVPNVKRTISFCENLIFGPRWTRGGSVCPI